MHITVGYKIVILFLFSHECEILSGLLRREFRLRMNEIMGSSRTFVPRKEEVR